MKKQSNSEQKPPLDIRKPESTGPRAQTETGKILKILKMQKDHPQFSKHRIPVMFRVQTPQSEQSYVLTYNELREKDQDLLLSYFEKITRIHDYPLAENLLPQHQCLQPNCHQPKSSCEDQIFLQEFFAQQMLKSKLMGLSLNQSEQNQMKLSPLMEQKSQMNQLDKNQKHFQDVQKPKELLEYQSLMAQLLANRDPITLKLKEPKSNEKLKSQCFLVGNSGCFDVEFNDPKQNIEDSNVVYDFDKDLQTVRITPYISEVYFQPIKTNLVAAQEGKNANPDEGQVKKQRGRPLKITRKQGTGCKKGKKPTKLKIKRKIIRKEKA